MPADHPNPLVNWLLDEAPFATSGRELTALLAAHMVSYGMPLWRLMVIVRTLHPQVVSFGYRWRQDDPTILETEATYLTLETPQFQNSPLLPIFEGAGGIRRRLDGPDPILDFGILEDLRREGASDYVAMPMTFSDGTLNALTLASSRPGGFSTTELGHVYEVLDNLGRLYEVHATRRIARTLLDTYLGVHAGTRVLKGQIKQGDGESIGAVIWFCDLRNSTSLAELMPREDFLGLLNQFFDAMAGAVMAQGGEVLRFIGDAALAIFPMESGAGDDNTPATAALAAAEEAQQRMAEVNQQRAADGDDPIGYGIALHIGDVTYGNIGTPERLEFTVIGEAANRAARIEGLCKQLGETLVLTSEFARYFPDRVRSLGKHTLSGVERAVEVFGLNR